MCAIHGTRRRALEINSLAVVAAAVTRTLEFVLARFPVGCASEMRTTRVDHKKTIGSAIHPDAVFLLEFRIYAQGKFGRIADFKYAIRFEQSAWKKEAEEGEEPGCKKSRNHGPDKAPSPPVISNCVMPSSCASCRASWSISPNVST